MNREDVAMDLTFENLDILRKEVQAAKLLLSECDEIFIEEGISNIELRGYLSGKLSADEVIELLDPPAEQRNQCDGCQAGIPLVDGAHRMGRPGGYPDLMSCQKERYKHPEQAEGAQGEREDGCCCPPSGFSGAWAAGPCPVHMGLRAALAQPSPCPFQFGNCMGADAESQCKAQPSPAPELEQVERFEPAHGTDRGGNVFAYMIDNEAGEYIEFAQHDRIIGALRAEIDEVDGLSKRLDYLLHQTAIALRGPEPALTRYGYADLPLRVKTLLEERDAAQARVAELEKQEPEFWYRDDGDGGVEFTSPGDGFARPLYAAPVGQAGQVPDGCAPGTYAIDYLDNWDGEGYRYFCIAEKTADGKWIRHESGQELLEYKGDAILAAWLLAASEAQECDK